MTEVSPREWITDIAVKESMTDIVDVYLVAAGKYHDIDFARLELLKLLAAHEETKVTTVSDYENIKEISFNDINLNDIDNANNN